MKNWFNMLTNRSFIFFTERGVKDQGKWKAAASIIILSSANFNFSTINIKIKDMQCEDSCSYMDLVETLII